MKDGRVNKCKECNKLDVKQNRENSIDYYREYDRNRVNRQTNEYRKEYKLKFPNKYKSHTLVANAIRAKKLFPEPCYVCGSKQYIHAHHDDYSKPLNVRWLCSACHSQWHKKHGEAKNP